MRLLQGLASFNHPVIIAVQTGAWHVFFTERGLAHKDRIQLNNYLHIHKTGDESYHVTAFFHTDHTQYFELPLHNKNSPPTHSAVWK
jgi:fructose/tagatose bisphosphate aldolase